MCTVTYFPLPNGYIMTSNRDEGVARLQASQPIKKSIGSHTIWFPQDMDALGTWFATKSDGQTFILFNGAKEKHLRKPPYKVSRGIVLLQLVQASDFLVEWNKLDLDQIEPFSVVVGAKQSLHLLRWNGTEKELELLDHTTFHIWSSSTLYTSAVAEQRRSWFRDFIETFQQKIDPSAIFNFHLTTKMEDRENGLIINREGLMFTKSITQSTCRNDVMSLKHFDLLTNEVTQLIGEVA